MDMLEERNWVLERREETQDDRGLDISIYSSSEDYKISDMYVERGSAVLAWVNVTSLPAGIRRLS